MKYTIEGFDQKTMVELGMDCTDACLLRWFVDFNQTGKMVKLKDNDVDYFWVKYKSVIDDMPLVGIKNKISLYRRFLKMKVFEHKLFKNEKGTFSCFKLNQEIFESLLTQKSNPSDSKVRPPSDSKVRPEYPSIKSNPSTKDIVDSSSTSPTRLITDTYYLLHKAKYNTNPLFVGGRDGAIVKELLKQQPADIIIKKLESYYQKEYWFNKTGHDLKQFKSHYNEILIETIQKQQVYDEFKEFQKREGI
jgi:hypothetical protein